MWLPLGSRMKASVGEASSGAKRVRRMSLMDVGAFSAWMGLCSSVAVPEQPSPLMLFHQHGSCHLGGLQTEATYVSDRCGAGLVKGIFEGLCQAMKPKTKTSIAPALTASASRGLRPPAEDSNIRVERTWTVFEKPHRSSWRG